MPKKNREQQKAELIDKYEKALSTLSSHSGLMGASYDREKVNKSRRQVQTALVNLKLFINNDLEFDKIITASKTKISSPVVPASAPMPTASSAAADSEPVPAVIPSPIAGPLITMPTTSMPSELVGRVLTESKDKPVAKPSVISRVMSVSGMSLPSSTAAAPAAADLPPASPTTSESDCSVVEADKPSDKKDEVTEEADGHDSPDNAAYRCAIM